MRFTIGRKLAGAFGTILGLMLLSTVLSYMKSLEMRSLQEFIVGTRVPTLEAIRELQRDLNQVISKARHAALAGTQPQRHQAARSLFEENWSTVQKDVTRLDDISKQWVMQENKDRLAEIERQLPGLKQVYEESMDLSASGQRDAIVKAGNMLADKGTVVNESIKAVLGDLASSNDKLMQQNSAALAKATATLNLTLWLSTGLALFIGVAVAILLSRRISNTTQSVLAQAEAIASGDLTRQDLKILSDDELGDLTQAINKVNQSLKDMIVAIADNAEHVASASTELSATGQQISANSEETSAQARVVSESAQKVSQNLQGVSAGAEEMSATIQSIAGNTHEAATIASKGVQTAQAANAKVSKLGDSSVEIGEVIKVITSIAEQTNLLALNATIEAARAGEAGKGFAVVANEVKELAMQTAKATEDIGRKITAIQVDTKGAVEAIGSVTSVITQVSDISGTIATAVEEQSATTREMTRNVTEAAKGSDEITTNIAGVADAARGTANNAHESQKAAEDLAHMASQLRGLVEQFKVDRKMTSLAAPQQSLKSMAATAGR
ncbi:MAG TPA: methyl-accepting chemotaxis protein [Verrucomicrobiae bacterium]|nr:methyl-accepting chemotaxis protein [Verrucomicrobiae bacterium]